MALHPSTMRFQTALSLLSLDEAYVWPWSKNLSAWLVMTHRLLAAWATRSMGIASQYGRVPPGIIQRLRRLANDAPNEADVKYVQLLCHFADAKDDPLCRYIKLHNPECKGPNLWAVLDSLMENVAAGHGEDSSKSRPEREMEHQHRNRFFEFCARHSIPRGVHTVPSKLRGTDNPLSLREILYSAA